MSENHDIKDDFYSIRMTDEYYNTLDKDYNMKGAVCWNWCSTDVEDTPCYTSAAGQRSI
jgi:hypothetical protein